MGANPFRESVNEDVLSYEMYGVLECIEDGISEKHFFLPEEMRFHTSWTWLMPVVDRIEGLRDTNGNAYRFTIDMCNAQIEGTPIEVSGGSYKRDATYKAVVEFIKWFNKKASKMTDNRLIAEFMDLEMEVSNKGIVEYYHIEFDSGEWYEAEDLPYDEWNGLMPVVSKILTNENLIGYRLRENIMDSLPYGMIKDTYDAVVEFIKWYNEQ